MLFDAGSLMLPLIVLSGLESWYFILSQKSKVKSQKLAGKIFVLTGGLESMSRDDAKERIRELGGDISSSVSKNVDYIILGSEPGEKYEKAKKLGVKIIDEKEFLKLIK